MGLFDNLKKDGLEESQDRLGGGFQLFESGVYPAKIKAAYVVNSSAADSKAMGVALILGLPGNKEYRETFWVTNRNGENFFTNDNGKKIGLPGFQMIDDLCLLAADKSLAELDNPEDKVVKIWNSEEKKEMPQNVPMLMELIDSEVQVGILKVIKNKQVKNDTTGKYQDTPESREENQVDKFFHQPTGLTVTEARNGGSSSSDAKFLKAWAEKNTGVTQDRRKIKGDAPGTPSGGVKSGRPGSSAPPQAGDSAPKTGSLFKK